jgi:NAD(P)-dependent dehydrogenase (short-subunit alcohol dehydrogenase family)
LITAGAAGIGFEIARAFLDAGARVCVCDADPNALDLARKRLPALVGYVLDVADSAGVRRLADALVAQWRGLDVLVNNAGIGGVRAPVDEIGDEEWDLVLRVNLTGMFYMVRAFAPTMKAQRSGCILNISTTSTRTGLPNRTPYVVSKAAVEGLTLNLARELGPYNIRVNAILPGSIENERGRELLRQKAERENVSYETALSRRLDFISMRTRIDPSEVAGVAVFLASDAARHVTGQRLSVDGNVEWEG